MNQDTPAVEIKEKDLNQNKEALAQLLQRIKGRKISTVLDVRYGLGGWAQVVADRFPAASILGYEQDTVTAHRAWRGNNTTILVERYAPTGKRKFDLALADFNTLTALKRELLDHLLEHVFCQWLVFTDVACGKLHLNYRSYGLKRPYLLSNYWEQFQVPGYRLVDWVRTHHAASTALFRLK